MRTVAILNYERYMTEVKVTEDLDKTLKEQALGIEITSILPSVWDFYEKQLLPRLKKERHWKRHYRFDMVCCCLADSPRKYSRKKFVEMLSVKRKHIVFDGALPFFGKHPEEDAQPLLWVRYVVIKA